MKRILLMFIAIAGLLFNTNAQGKFDSWHELKAFHKVMSQTFHPSEKGDLEPIKSRISEMVEKADVLAKSNIPVEFNSKQVVAAVNKLKKDSIKLQKIINNKADDKKVTLELNKLHDVFHRIIGLCNKDDHHHDHDHEHKHEHKHQNK